MIIPTVLKNSLTSLYCIAIENENCSLWQHIYFFITEASSEFQSSKERTGVARPTSTQSKVISGWRQKAGKPGHPKFNPTSQVSLICFAVLFIYLFILNAPLNTITSGSGWRTTSCTSSRCPAQCPREQMSFTWRNYWTQRYSRGRPEKRESAPSAGSSTPSASVRSGLMVVEE